MAKYNRRELIACAAAMGATCVFAVARPRKSTIAWTERRESYPEGVASGDPTSDSIVLWTRYAGAGGASLERLTVEIAADPQFQEVVAVATATASAAAGGTCRVVVGGLRAACEYWYRFTDAGGHGSRVGRTLTAPASSDPRPVRFAFVSCQNCNTGAQNAWRRMIYEDERAPSDARLGFVLQLGDFIYEIVWYPKDRPQGMYDRALRDIVQYPRGEKISDFHVPVDVEDYRAIYRAYLHDPDVQDARARWPFVHMWDNHEFSWLGWQSLQKFGGKTRPAQSRKVAANQAWFEFQPGRFTNAAGKALDTFEPPPVVDAPITEFDEHGLGREANNLRAIGSLTGYRAVRWGRNVEILVTDQRSYRSEDPLGREEAAALQSEDFPELIPQEAAEILEAGRSYLGGSAPASIPFGTVQLANFRKDEPAQTFLGATQKDWFLHRLASSPTTWKVWANTIATLDARADPANLPAGLTRPWPGSGYAVLPLGDFATAYTERGEIYDWVREKGITGFVTVAGDRHSFWAGLAAKSLPPEKFEPVGIAFVTGSLSAPGVVESLEYHLPKTHPLRALYLADKEEGAKPDASLNMLVLHGVRSCLEYRRSRDLARARQLTNPDLAPHLSLADYGGHGYSVVTATSEWIDTEFVCIPRPVERATGTDGGPIRYRVAHRAHRWARGERPRLEQRILEGDPGLAI
jgi:alkaline phosphatase D